MGVTVEVWRGPLIESRHRVCAAVYSADGGLLERAGDPELVTFARSTLKPIQALPLLEDGIAERFQLSDRELALCSGSHNGEPLHVEVARSILEKAGIEEDALACGASRPYSREAARALRAAGQEPRRVHHNCSGKHAGMLALARGHGWSSEGYHEAAHPVQRRMLESVAHWTGSDAQAIPTGVDGCGVVTFALPLSRLARAFARLGAAAVQGEAAPARIVRAMAAHPDMVAGEDRVETKLARATNGRVLAKIGAEGVFAALVPEQALGVALKVEDGGWRATEPALIAILAAHGLLTEDELAALAVQAEPELTNSRGERVGVIRAVAALEPDDG